VTGISFFVSLRSRFDAVAVAVAVAVASGLVNQSESNQNFHIQTISITSHISSIN